MLNKNSEAQSGLLHLTRNEETDKLINHLKFEFSSKRAEKKDFLLLS